MSGKASIYQRSKSKVTLSSALFGRKPATRIQRTIKYVSFADFGFHPELPSNKELPITNF